MYQRRFRPEVVHAATTGPPSPSTRIGVRLPSGPVAPSGIPSPRQRSDCASSSAHQVPGGLFFRRSARSRSARFRPSARCTVVRAPRARPTREPDSTLSGSETDALKSEKILRTVLLPAFPIVEISNAVSFRFAHPLSPVPADTDVTNRYLTLGLCNKSVRRARDIYHFRGMCDMVRRTVVVWSISCGFPGGRCQDRRRVVGGRAPPRLMKRPLQIAGAATRVP